MKIGLALAGGGARGIAHAGAIRALEENGIHIDLIGGSSSGSLVSALYAMGYSPKKIYKLFNRYSKKIVKLNNNVIIKEIGNYIFGRNFKTKGIKDGIEIEELFNKLALKAGILKMSDIEMPLVIPAVDISNSEKYIFCSKNTRYNNYINDIPVGVAVRSSSSFPLVYAPCIYEEHIFLDGGILENIPAKELKRIGADKVISIKFDSDTVDTNSNVMDILMKTLDIMGSKISEESLNESDVILTIPTDGTGLLETDKAKLCYNSGYETVIKNIDNIKRILDA